MHQPTTRPLFVRLIPYSLSLLVCLLAGCLAMPAAPIPAATADAATDTATSEPSAAIFALNQRLGRGVNLGNALEAAYEGEWGMVLEADYFRLIAAAGFTSVRVPIRWSAHAAEAPPYTIDAQFLQRIDWVIEQALQNDLLVVINIHHYDAMMQDPDGERARFLGIWQQLAEHYQKQPPELLFELLNEPHTNLLPYRWNALVAETIALIRQTNPTRGLVVGPTSWNNLNDLVNLELPAEDQNLIVTFHLYEPFHFTHQGAEWVNGADAWLGTTWEGATAQQRQLTTLLDKATEWAAKRQRPLFMGEFGAYSKADLPSRERWTAFVARRAEERGISWAYWEFGAGFGVYDRERNAWRTELLNALIQ
ncbi:MAG: glycoside hydrolase family 5 protein [Caldilineaceae bacterium]|nr:glycoside hydrolase family 5 protein [Caldilineaceae bacterium]